MAIGGRDQTDICPPGLAAAERIVFAGLEEAQQQLLIIVFRDESFADFKKSSVTGHDTSLRFTFHCTNAIFFVITKLPARRR